MSPRSPDFMSREIAAGYDPVAMDGAAVLVIGAGAVGSNLVQTLELSGVGETRIVDDDVVDLSNLTRSPLFLPSDTGSGKAHVLARRAARIAYASTPRLRYAHARIRDVGLGAFEGVQVAVAVVDSLESRAEIADMARLTGTPLIECGFDGSVIHVTTWSNREATAPCFRCLVPGASPERASCSIYARAAVSRGFLPAVQTAAAVAGNLAAESAIQVLHGRFPCAERYVEFDITRGASHAFAVTRRSECDGAHLLLPAPAATVLGRTATAHDVFAAVPRFRAPVILLPDAFLVSAPCADCGAKLVVGEVVRRVSLPRCNPCHSAHHGGDVAVHAVRDLRPTDTIAGYSLERLGYGARDVVLVLDSDTENIATVRLDDPTTAVFTDVTWNEVAT